MSLFDSISYFNWWLVAAYVVVVGLFLYGVLRPRKSSQWKSAGIAQAWVIALYAEMYGLPLTAYLVMGWLGHSVADAETHFNGHLWPFLFGLQGTSLQLAQLWTTIIGQSMIVVGALIATIGWRQIYHAARSGQMAESGIYRFIRHPQYTGFFLFLIGSVLNWPTIPTLITLPIISWVYVRLARSEEQDAIRQFGARYENYMARTGRFFPRLAL